MPYSEWMLCSDRGAGGAGLIALADRLQVLPEIIALDMLIFCA